ncbi:MAG: 30S ribosomal protein S27ae [Candidatus Brockarchaeota archaeon]|nr:30S ribosomal protein S27ae [Candidatus Brockarchaeota archaeon]MBO3809621.1 30S ribosomal protein S27ae [Candidatus Brockarchaeota archaeon]
MKDTVKYYEVDASKASVRLRNRKCPRCGRVMAFHKEVKPRWHCGACNYTEFQR